MIIWQTENQFIEKIFILQDSLIDCLLNETNPVVLIMTVSVYSATEHPTQHAFLKIANYSCARELTDWLF